MSRPLDYLKVANGDLLLAKDMQDALTAATLVFGDGARQTFTADGKTTYVEHGGSTQGEWSIVQDGEFSSFWPEAVTALTGATSKTSCLMLDATVGDVGLIVRLRSCRPPGGGAILRRWRGSRGRRATVG
jgi:hypothetical protein